MMFILYYCYAIIRNINLALIVIILIVLTEIGYPMIYLRFLKNEKSKEQQLEEKKFIRDIILLIV